MGWDSQVVKTAYSLAKYYFFKVDLFNLVYYKLPPALFKRTRPSTNLSTMITTRISLYLA